MTKTYIGLGTNVGDKEANIKTALKHLKAEREIKVLRVASLYYTEPIGLPEQEWFVNTVVEVETSLPPFDLLSKLILIENRMGRNHNIYWGPRVIDLDILLYGEIRVNIPGLQIPHPRMIDRAFVLVPLAELEPDMLLEGRRIDVLAEQLSTRQKIERLSPVTDAAHTS